MLQCENAIEHTLFSMTYRHNHFMGKTAYEMTIEAYGNPKSIYQ